MRDLERKLRTDLFRAILELEAPPPEQAQARRKELTECSIDDLRAVLQRLRGLRGPRARARGEGTAPDIVVRAMLASKDEWLTMREIVDQARMSGHAIETERVSTALANLEFASGRRGRSAVHAGYAVEVVRKRRPFLYRLVKLEPDANP